MQDHLTMQRIREIVPYDHDKISAAPRVTFTNNTSPGIRTVVIPDDLRWVYDRARVVIPQTRQGVQSLIERIARLEDTLHEIVRADDLCLCLTTAKRDDNGVIEVVRDAVLPCTVCLIRESLTPSERRLILYV